MGQQYTSFFSAVLLLTLSTTSVAQTEPSYEPLTELTINGPGYLANRDDPFTFKEIDTEEIQDSLVGKEPSEFLSKTPSISYYADSGGYQGYSYFRLRGIDQTRLNVTLDGVPLNEPEDQGAYFSNYPDLFNSISTFQIIRGVGLSQNGTASYGGSLPLESFDLASAKGASFGVGAGSFGTAREYASYNSGLENGRGLYLRAANLNTDGYRRASSNRSQSLFYKAGLYENDSSWTLTGFVGHQENDLAWIGATREEIARDRRFNANSPDEDDHFLQSLTAIRNVERVLEGTLSTSLYYNYLNGDYDFDLNNFLGLPRTKELFNYDFESHFVGLFSTYSRSFHDTDVTVGVHGNRYERVHTGSEKDLGRLYQNTGRKNELSAFTKVEHHVDAFTAFTDLQVRHTYFDYYGAVPLEQIDWNFFNPKVGLSYKVSEQRTLYYSVGRTGREPTRTDLFFGNDDLLTDESGAPLLNSTKAEFVIDHELGYRSFTADSHFSANLFYMDFDDELVLNGKVGPNSLMLTQSVDKSFRSGVEVDYDLRISPKVLLRGNASYHYSRIKESSETFTPVITPAFLVNQGIRYTEGRTTVDVDGRYQSSSYIDFANTARIGNFISVDVAVHYQLDSVRLGVHANNIFDQDYFTNGYFDGAGAERYFVSAPANFLVTAEWKL